MHHADEERMMGRPSPGNIEAASKWLTNLANDADQISGPASVYPETRGTPGEDFTTCLAYPLTTSRRRRVDLS